MDEYIKREDALDAVLFALVGTGYQSRAIDAIRDVPTANVTPIADTVRKMQKRLKAKANENEIFPYGGYIHFDDIDQIAEKMLEEGK